MNFTNVDVSASDGEFIAKNNTLALNLSRARGEKPATVRGSVVMGIRPEDISIAPDGNVQGEIFVIEPLGRENLVDVRIDGESFLLLF